MVFVHSIQTHLRMYPYKSLERSEVIDMLSNYTVRLMEIIINGGSKDEYHKCKEAIEKLQNEIHFRDTECDISSPNHALQIRPINYRQ
ncbi:MAG TPA: hypothetical protein VF487_04060 [Chitinophagaceae bacterium]